MVTETRVFQAADGENLVILACNVFKLIHPCDEQTEKQMDRIVTAKMRWKQLLLSRIENY